MNYYKTLFTISLLLMFVVSSPALAQNKAHPNIIYILADDLGYGDVGAFNEESKIKTPHLDLLAAEGMIFTDAHTSSSVCTPTRYGILTGRYNWRSELKEGVLWGESEALIPTERTTVASLLQNQGYHTAFIGKWHLGWNFTKDKEGNIDFEGKVTHTPNDLGFNYAYGHNGSLDMPPYVYVENGKVTAIPTETTVNTDFQGFWRKGLTAPDFVHQEVTPHFFEKAKAYIQERSKTNQPFFLYLPLPSPHTPVLPDQKWLGKSGLNPYADFVMMIDDYVGDLLQSVKTNGLENNTIVIFTSDNGCSPRAKFDELKSKGHNPSYKFRGHKADIFEGGHRVPFIVKWPAQIKAGQSSDEIICTTDLMATCAAIVDYKLRDHEGEDSYNLLPLLKGKKLKNPLREATVHHSINGSFAIRQGDWKLIMCPDSGGWSEPKPNTDASSSLAEVQLYHLKDDIAETNNLEAQYPEKVAELKSLLNQYIQAGRSTPGKKQQNEGNAEWKHLWWLSSHTAN
ncbi:arylsulfatase [Porifericola rhodea]|uniref:sulfatase family protein n=1 Tax=Porifericola rhodea TaxID=930972 RepID=UPI0026651D5F|nr:arylsulfatase [Porifericola rhodea]WKN30870.1 arylsulfatase [Porifericola rhodea]